MVKENCVILGGLQLPKNFLGSGWKYPVTVDFEGKIAVSKYETDVEEAILIILGMAKGERVMRPDFGCGIRDFVLLPLTRLLSILWKIVFVKPLPSGSRELS